MKPIPTIIAAIRRPLKIKVVNANDAIALHVNRIFKTKLASNKLHLNLLKEMTALDIANNKFYAEVKVTLKVKTKIDKVSIGEILSYQTELLREKIAETRDAAKEIAMQKTREKFEKQKSNKK